MTPPTGYVRARRVSGVVKVADRTDANTGVIIPGATVGPGDIHIVSEGEAHESDLWEVVVPEPRKTKGDS